MLMLSVECLATQERLAQVHVENFALMEHCQSGYPTSNVMEVRIRSSHVLVMDMVDMTANIIAMLVLFVNLILQVSFLSCI
jgi:hypothetical protein